MMKRLVSVMVLAACVLCAAVPAVAAGGEQTTTIPVTLTIVNSTKNLDVTMPAAMPVSVVDGKVLTADNVEIRNNSKILDVEIASVLVRDGQYRVGSYEDFPEGSDGVIAMQLNGVGTTGAGALAIDKTSFPDVEAGKSLPVNYKAKVSEGRDVSGLEAASVVFVLRGIK